MYRYISRESCSQFDSLPLTSLTISKDPIDAADSDDSDASQQFGIPSDVEEAAESVGGALQRSGADGGGEAGAAALSVLSALHVRRLRRAASNSGSVVKAIQEQMRDHISQNMFRQRSIRELRRTVKTTIGALAKEQRAARRRDAGRAEERAAAARASHAVLSATL